MASHYYCTGWHFHRKREDGSDVRCRDVIKIETAGSEERMAVLVYPIRFIDQAILLSISSLAFLLFTWCINLTMRSRHLLKD